MARFLFATWPFTGDVYPQISIAAALRARGHAVAFYTGVRMRALLENEQFDCFPFQQVNEGEVCDIVTSMESRAVGWQAPGHLVHVMRRWLVDTIPDQVADLDQIVTSWRPDVLVTSPFLYAPFLVIGETRQLSVAISSTLLFCLVPGPHAPAFGPGLPPPRGWRARLVSRAAAIATDVLAGGLRRRVNTIRAMYRLPSFACSVNVYAARQPLYLVPSVPELDYQRRDLPPSVHYVGPCIWNGGERSVVPTWLGELSTDRPWVHVTEGTLHYREPFVLRAAAQGLADLPMEVILTTGPQRKPEDMQLGPLATNIRVAQWIGHGDLLSRCAVVVTTGGAGTVMAALEAGVPLVIVPTHWDKPDNAQRVVEAGVGLRLSPRRCTPRRLRTAVERVLSEPSFRANAQRLARQLAGERGPERAAELLEDLAASAESRMPGRGAAGLGRPVIVQR